MGARDVITAVMAELSIDVPAVSWGIRQITEGNAPPRIDWEPMQGSFRGPQMAGHNPRPLRDRWTRWDVRCWGATLDDTEALLNALVRALHRALTIGGFDLEGEVWAEIGAVTDGDQVTVGVYLGIPILDRPQPSISASLNANGSVRP